MAEETEDQEKTEEATPRRLEKAREDGQVARSRELTTVMLLFGGVGGLWSMGPTLFDQVGMVMEQSFLFDRRQGFDSTVMLTHAVYGNGRNRLERSSRGGNTGRCGGLRIVDRAKTGPRR